MKHIKSYKLFESEEIYFINDLFLEIKDIGFDVEINSKSGKIDIKVKKNLTESEFEEEFTRPDFKAVNMGSFRLSLIKDTLLSVISYLTDSGYDLESVFCYGGDFNVGNKSNGELMDLDEFKDLTGDTFLSTVMLDFRKPKKYWL